MVINMINFIYYRSEKTRGLNFAIDLRTGTSKTPNLRARHSLKNQLFKMITNMLKMLYDFPTQYMFLEYDPGPGRSDWSR